MQEIKSKIELEAAISNNKIVLIDFYNDFCAPCEMLDIELSQIENALVCRVNIISLLELAKELDITKIPSILIYHKGMLKLRINGYRTKKYMQEIIEKLILEE